MANKYVNSGAAGTNAGTSEANAWTTLAASSTSAADKLFIKSTHSESGAVTPTIGGTLAGGPVQLLSTNWAAEPPTALAAGATINFTASYALSSSNMYAYGVNWTMTGSLSSVLTLADAGNAKHFYDTCNFSITSTGGSAKIEPGGNGSNNATLCEWSNCGIKFGSTAQGIQFGCKFRSYGGSLLAGGTTPTNLITSYAGNRPLDAIFYGLDLTNAGTTMNLAIGGTIASGGLLQFIDPKLPSSWTGSLVNAQINSPGTRVEMWGYRDPSNDLAYRFWIEDCGGNVKHETTIVRTAGFVDGVTPLSWKFTSSANAWYPTAPLVGPKMVAQITTTGSSVTVTVHGVYDSVTNLKNDQLAIRVFELDSGRTIAVTTPTDVLTANADLASDSGEAWTTTGITNVNKFKLSAAFTPSVQGAVGVEVLMFVANAGPYYIDPKVNVA